MAGHCERQQALAGAAAAVPEARLVMSAASATLHVPIQTTHKSWGVRHNGKQRLPRARTVQGGCMLPMVRARVRLCGGAGGRRTGEVERFSGV